MPNDDLINALAQTYAGMRSAGDLRNKLAGDPSIPPPTRYENAVNQGRALHYDIPNADPVQMAMGLLGPNARGAGALASNAARKITAYHGSPRRDIEEFVTPTFFSPKEGIAKSYRNDGGGMDNLNGLGATDIPRGYYGASSAMEKAGNDRARAIELLHSEMRDWATPHPEFDYMPRSLVDVLLGRPKQLKPGVQSMLDNQRDHYQSGIDYLQSNGPVGMVYKVELPEPTAHYDGVQKKDIADAIAKGHKVITWGGSADQGGEIIALDKTVIKILEKYGMAGAAALPGLALLGRSTDGEPQQ